MAVTKPAKRTKITTAALTRAGYKRVNRSNPKQWLNNADALFQKRVKDGKTILYFINVWYYDFPKNFPQSGAGEGFQPEVQYNSHVRQQTFDVMLHPNKKVGVKDMEEFFSRIYTQMGCQPYEVNGE